jgi:hypothetical protein
VTKTLKPFVPSLSTLPVVHLQLPSAVVTRTKALF